MLYIYQVGNLISIQTGSVHIGSVHVRLEELLLGLIRRYSHQFMINVAISQADKY